MRPHGFDVREVQGGTGTLAFGYRVVAKRKDIAGAAPGAGGPPGGAPAARGAHATAGDPAVPPLPDPNAPPRVMPMPGAARDR